MSTPDPKPTLHQILARLVWKSAVLPPATTTDLADAEARLGRRLPPELRQLLNHTIGWQTPYPLGLAGQLGGVSRYELHPHALHLWDDGFGNSFIYDVGGDDTDPARVLFDCHDPPAIIFISASLIQFLEWAASTELREPNPLDQLETWLAKFSETGPGAIVERGFTRTLAFGERSTTQLTCDSAPGDGFWWAAPGGELAARRLGDAPDFELWQEPE